MKRYKVWLSMGDFALETQVDAKHAAHAKSLVSQLFVIRAEKAGQLWADIEEVKPIKKAEKADVVSDEVKLLNG